MKAGWRRAALGQPLQCSLAHLPQLLRPASFLLLLPAGGEAGGAHLSDGHPLRLLQASRRRGGHAGGAAECWRFVWAGAGGHYISLWLHLIIG